MFSDSWIADCTTLCVRLPKSSATLCLPSSFLQLREISTAPEFVCFVHILSVSYRRSLSVLAKQRRLSLQAGPLTVVEVRGNVAWGGGGPVTGVVSALDVFDGVCDGRRAGARRQHRGTRIQVSADGGKTNALVLGSLGEHTTAQPHVSPQLSPRQPAE